MCVYISYGTYNKSMRKKSPQGKERYMKEETLLAHKTSSAKLLTIAISPLWKACFNKIQHAANIFFAIKTNKQSRIYEKNKNTGVPWIDFLSTCELRKKTQINLRSNIYIDQVEYYQAPSKQVLQVH